MVFLPELDNEQFYIEQIRLDDGWPESDYIGILVLRCPM